MSEGVMKNNCSKGSPGVVEKQGKRLNQRQKARILLIFFCSFSGGDSHTWSGAS